jgi:ketosteroid isomerase-like protein
MQLKPQKYYEYEKENEVMVQEYFKRIKSGDVQRLLELFSDDSVVYEPFSKSKRLFGKAEIEPFLRTVIMANEGVQYELKIAQQKNNSKGNLVVLVTFRKENEIRSRLTFAFESSDHFKFIRRIKSLLIEFID